MGDVFEGFENENSGLVPHLYAFLWSKNNLLQTRCQHHKCPLIVIPDTVVLQGREPTHWYFTSLKTGTMQRRSKDIDMDAACEILKNKSDPGLDVVATLIELKKGHFQPAVHYLTQPLLSKYCSAGPSKSSLCSVLQVFNQPKGTSNFVIRVEWTRDDVRMDSCININKLADASLPVPDRTTTNDDRNCVMIPLHGNVLAEQLSNMSACITDHIQFISSNRYSVGRLVCNYRIDSSDRVWLLWCETLDLIDNARVVQPVAESLKMMSPNSIQRKQEMQQPLRRSIESKDYASGVGYTSLDSGADDREPVPLGGSSKASQRNVSGSRYDLRPDSRESMNSFASSVMDARFDSMVHPSSAERVEMSSREQGPARPQHAKGKFFQKPWERSDTEDGGDSDAIAIGYDAIPLGEEEDPFFPSNVLTPSRDGNGHFMLLGATFGEKESRQQPKKTRAKLRNPVFIKPRSATPSEDDAMQYAEPPGESDLESTPFQDKKHVARPKSTVVSTLKSSREEEARLEIELADKAREKARKMQLRAKQGALEAAKRAQEEEVARAEKMRLKDERAKERERVRLAQEREKEDEKKRALETLREQARIEDSKKRDALEKKKAGSAVAKSSRDAKMKEESALEQSKRKTMPRKVKSPVRGVDTDQEAAESDARQRVNTSSSLVRNEVRDESPTPVLREVTPNPYDAVDPTELLMSAFGPPSPTVADSTSNLHVSENEQPRELHPDYEGRKVSAQAVAAAAAAEAAAAAAVAAQAAASAHTAAAAEEAAAAATCAAMLATAAAATASADVITVPAATRVNLHSSSANVEVESLPPADNFPSPRVAPWLQEARTSVKDLAASPAQHQQFLEFTKEPGLADEYLPSPNIKKDGRHSGPAPAVVSAQQTRLEFENSPQPEAVLPSQHVPSNEATEIHSTALVLDISSSSRMDAHVTEVLTRPSPVERATGAEDTHDSRFSQTASAHSQNALPDDSAQFRTGVEAAARAEVPPPSREAADRGSAILDSDQSSSNPSVSSKEAGYSMAPADIRTEQAHLEHENSLEHEDLLSFRPAPPSQSAGDEDSRSISSYASGASVSSLLSPSVVDQDGKKVFEIGIRSQALEVAAPVLDISSSSRMDAHVTEVLTRPSPVERATGAEDTHDSRFSQTASAYSQNALPDDSAQFRTGVEAAARAEVPPPSREAADRGSIPFDRPEQLLRSAGFDVKVAGESSDFLSCPPDTASGVVRDTISRNSDDIPLASAARRDEYEDSIISHVRNPAQQERAVYNSSVSATAHALANPFSQSVASVTRQMGETTGRDAMFSVSSIKPAASQARSIAPDAEETAVNPGIHGAGSTTSALSPPESDDRLLKAAAEAVDELVYNPELMSEPGSHIPGSGVGRHRSGMGYGKKGMVAFDDARECTVTPFGVHVAIKVKEPPSQQKIGALTTIAQGVIVDPRVAISDMSALPPRLPTRLEVNTSKLLSSDPCISTPALRESTQAQVNTPADLEDDVEFLVVDDSDSGNLGAGRPSTSSGRMDVAEDKCSSERPVSVLGNRPKGRMAPNSMAKLGFDDDALKGNLPPLPPQEESAKSVSHRTSVDSHSTLGAKLKGKEVRGRDNTIEMTSVPIPIRRAAQSDDVRHHSENPDLPPTETEKKSLYDGILGAGEEADLDTLKLIFKANNLTGSERSRKSGKDMNHGVAAASHESVPTLSSELGGESEDRDAMRQTQWMPRESFPGGRQKGLQHVDVPTVTKPWGAQHLGDGLAPPSPIKKQPEKVRGINVDRAREAVKDRCLDGHKKDDNWAFDEFALGQGEAVNEGAGGAGIPGGASATLELKFDCAFDDDDSRLAFAERQRVIIAQMLGVSVSEIEVEDAKPGSPVTVVKFKLASQGVRSVQASAAQSSSGSTGDASVMFERPAIGAAIQGGSAGPALMSRVQSGLPNVTVVSRDVSLSESTAALKQSLKVSCTEDDVVRHIVEERSKSIESSGNADSAIANAAEDKSSSSEQDSAKLGSAKVPGVVVQSEHSSDMKDDSSARPSRAIDPAQYSSTNKEKKSGRNKERLKLHQKVSQFAVEIPLKVPNLEVADTLRVKEAELELEALPAARAEEAPRAGALVRKAEGIEDARDLSISEYERRFEERTKTLSELAPSLQLSKSAEDGVYALPQKIFGDENAKTRLPSEPSGISTGDRNQKRKGKDAQKVELAAVPEHYMAFGTEGESQRLPIDAAAVEAPSAVVPPERPPPGASAKPAAGSSALLAATALAASNSPAKIGKKVDFGDSTHAATRASLQVTSNKATFDIQEGGDSKSASVKQPQDGFEEEDVGSSNPIQSVQKRLPRKAAAKSHLLTRIHSIESTLQRLYSKLETEADVVADIGEFEEGVERIANSGKTPSNPAARNLALALLDERDAPVVHSRSQEYENQGDGSKSARAKMVSSINPSGQSMATGSVGASSGTKIGISAYDHPVFEPKVVERGPLDSSTPTEANEEDLLAQIVRERDIRRARLENRRVGGNQTADDDELIQPSLSSATAPLKSTASAKEVTFSSSPGYSMRGSAVLLSSDPSASSLNIGSETKGQRLEASAIHSPASAVAASPALATGQRRGSVAVLKTAVKASVLMSMGSDEVDMSPSKTRAHDTDDYIPDLGGQTNVAMPDGGNPLSQEEQSEYLLWKNVFSAVRHGRRNEVISSLEAGCPVDIRDTAGNTLFIIASQNGNKNMCKALLRRGSDINAANHRGQVALHFCYQYGFADLAAYLVTKGADDTIQNIFGKTPQEGLE